MSATKEHLVQRTWEVPDYTVTELRPKQHKYCICVFVINEGQRIITQLSRMRPLAKEIDIVVADGGSTDGSLAIDNLITQTVRTLLIKQGPGKLSAQMRMAFAYALEQDYQGVVTIDGNNKDDPKATALFIHALDAGYDHIQGSRYMPGGVARNTPFSRHWGIKLVHAPLISVAARHRYTDTTNGFRGYSARFLKDPKVRPLRDVFNEYDLHYYLAIRAARLNYKILEVPVTREYPVNGKIPTKISPIGGSLTVMKNLLKSVFLLYDPKE